MPAASVCVVKFTSDIDHDTVTLAAEFSGYTEEMYLEADISFRGEPICQDRYFVNNHSVFHRSIHLSKNHILYSTAHEQERLWSPENPALFDITLRLVVKGIVVDTVESYFGMRKIHTRDGITYLNNRPYYFKLILDQGYWKDGILAAPSDDDFVKDIRIMKEMGFNGCRKHQKVEDSRFLYHADKMGFLVWGEMASACLFTDKGIAAYAKEWFEVLRRDYNHPSIVAWVPFNESWSIPNVDSCKRQQDQTLGMYHLLKSLDATRLVVNNDGWEMTRSDICAIQNYAHGSGREPEKQAFFKRSMQDKDILQSDLIYGFCYTQLSDVEQETNGLLTYDRIPKCDPAKIREINSRYRHNIVIR